jgi:hypothetical protein
MSNGYDGSMMNGLQTLENWRNYFNNPTGGTLGLFNAIQVSSLAVVAWSESGLIGRTSVPLLPSLLLLS